MPSNFQVSDWQSLEEYFQELLSRELQDANAVRQWFRDRSELEAVISEELGWRYIRMTTDTTNDKYRDDFTYFITEVDPKVAVFSNDLNLKIGDHPCLDDLPGGGFELLRKNLKKEIRIFRKENVAIHTELQNLSKEYGNIAGAMTVTIDGHELTLQQAAVFLENNDRNKRAEAYNKISERRLQDRDQLDNLFTRLVVLRNDVALNADFDNYTDYKFTALGRFDYTKQDCFDFHESVRSEVVPLINEMAERRKEQLGYDRLRPWDKAVEPTGEPSLKPFSDTDDLLEKTMLCFGKLDPFLRSSLELMRSMDHLDLESRKGKAPGGYNYPLTEIGVPFIFMNATSTLRDMVTLLHEGGHAVHSIITRDLELVDFQHTPSEVAELASMTMELITMDHWGVFFDNADDLKRARRQHLEQVIETLPWVAVIDKFQHWIYENPHHDHLERKKKWVEIFSAFTDRVTDWSGLEQYRDFLWQKQLHLFEVPFYYIEYGIAQLGAIAMWKCFKEDPKRATLSYLEALRLGYTCSVPEIYRAAGIEFNFKKDYIRDLMHFVRDELEALQ